MSTGPSPKSISMTHILLTGGAILALGLVGYVAANQPVVTAIEAQAQSLPHNTTWVLLCTALVVMMQLGFALLESGLVDVRIVVSVLYKNMLDFCAGVVAYVLVGYWIQFGEHPLAAGFAHLTTGPYELVSPYAHFIYQAAFATTATTIISGAIAGRMKLGAYVIYTLVVTGLVYPATGKIIWVWFQPAGLFHDLAGSVGVHTVGGAAALMGTLLLEPRLDRTAPPHSVPLAVSGTFLLMVGWFGFNMGSVGLDVTTAEGMRTIAKVGFNTTLAGAVAGLVAWHTGCILRLPKLSLAINGVLGGLVAITCSADAAHPLWTIALGAAAGFLISLYGWFMEKRNLGRRWFDDPVGAVPVHLGCGILGGVSAALLPVGAVFSVDSKAFPLLPDWLKHLHLVLSPHAQLCQVVLTLLIPGLVALTMWIIMVLPAKKGWLRESKDVERLGMDRQLYAEDAYDFQNSPLQLTEVLSRINLLLEELEANHEGYLHPSGAYAFAPFGQMPFKRRFADWISQADRLVASYNARYSHLSIVKDGQALSSSALLENVADSIFALMKLHSKNDHERAKPFKGEMGKIEEQLKKMRELVEAQIVADSSAVGEAVQQVKVEVASLDTKLEESLEEGGRRVGSIEDKLVELEERLRQMTEANSSRDYDDIDDEAP